MAEMTEPSVGGAAERPAPETGQLLAERDRLLNLLRRVRLRLFDSHPEHGLERDIMDTLRWYGDDVAPLEDAK